MRFLRRLSEKIREATYDFTETDPVADFLDGLDEHLEEVEEDVSDGIRNLKDVLTGRK